MDYGYRHWGLLRQVLDAAPDGGFFMLEIQSTDDTATHADAMDTAQKADDEK
jgi:hypothetical protein